MFRPILNSSATAKGLGTYSRSNITLRTTVRLFSNVPPMDQYESKIYEILKTELQPVNLEVKDVSGGCGSMFAINVESEKFSGIPMIKQHRLVNEILKDEISKWHGLQLQTKAAKK